ncbi:MAG: enoyl-CoA hydratase/isomerase family protein, partial [Phenylobacterium sp.]|nr:enoyl-CoA hydratase/isomerase family protein [Phenylobacterium sp.]MBP9756867.1 enoyl-CoA hydratase/isomerase family protein [Phenylobacterium sp.]
MSETLAQARADQSAEVLYDVAGGVATITLNRPERLNTISGPMLSLLSRLLLQADADPEVRCVILTGTGRAFCAGLDLVSATSGSGIGSESQVSTISVDLDLKTAPPTV